MGGMFIFPSLLWFLPVVLLVVLIHLIHMFRHRHLPWGAMEFLLASYQKSRARILLQQLLLLLLRTLVAAFLVFAFAGPRLSGRLAERFGGRSFHHIVLLDDSYSMGERNDVDGTLFERALTLLTRITEQDAVNRGDRLSLVRASRALELARGGEPDFAERILDPENRSFLASAFREFDLSESSAGPEELLEAAERIVSETTSRTRPVVYLLSDFRAKNWRRPEPLLQRISSITSNGQFRAIRLTGEERPNVGIESVRPLEGILAADIEILLEARLINHGPDPLDNVHLGITIDDMPQVGQVFPHLPGDGVPRALRIPIRFPEGREKRTEHRVTITLPPDSIPDDNAYSFVMNVPDQIDVLLIAEPTPAALSAASQVRSALAPGGVHSGIRVHTESPRYLSTEPLDAFRTIILLDIPAFDPPGIRALEQFAEKGGGIAFFLGPATDPRSMNATLFRGDQGIFPVELLGEERLAPDFLNRAADLTVTEHPLFRLFRDEGAPLLAPIRIERFFDTVISGTKNDGVTAIASLRNGKPLVLEKRFGQGRVVAFLTTASTEWNNWGANPGFVVMMLDLIAYLSEPANSAVSSRIGEALDIRFDPTRYEKTVRIVPPAKHQTPAGQVRPIHLEARLDSNASDQAVAGLLAERSGFYAFHLTRLDAMPETRYAAVNVDPSEGEIRLLEKGELTAWLQGVGGTVENGDSFRAVRELGGEHSVRDILLVLIVLLLITEMFLAGRMYTS